MLRFEDETKRRRLNELIDKKALTGKRTPEEEAEAMRLADELPSPFEPFVVESQGVGRGVALIQRNNDGSVTVIRPDGVKVEIPPAEVAEIRRKAEAEALRVTLEAMGVKH